MRSSAEALNAALTRVASNVHGAVADLDGADRNGFAPVVLIDGRSGAGKSSLAARLVDGWSGPVQLIGLDELYPGWDGLAEASRIVESRILTPLRAGQVARWHRWDWVQDEPGEARETQPGIPLIIEGAGALTPATAQLASVGVWLDAPADTRRERALARDGETYRPHWERWAAQEERHLAENDPRALASLVATLP